MYYILENNQWILYPSIFAIDELITDCLNRHGKAVGQIDWVAHNDSERTYAEFLSDYNKEIAMLKKRGTISEKSIYCKDIKEQVHRFHFNDNATYAMRALTVVGKKELHQPDWWLKGWDDSCGPQFEFCQSPTRNNRKAAKETIIMSYGS